MKIDVCHSLTGELLEIELPENALVEELRHVLKVQRFITAKSSSNYRPVLELNTSRMDCTEADRG